MLFSRINNGPWCKIWLRSSLSCSWLGMLPGTWAYVSAGAFGRAIIVSLALLCPVVVLLFANLTLVCCRRCLSFRKWLSFWLSIGYLNVEFELDLFSYLILFKKDKALIVFAIVSARRIWCWFRWRKRSAIDHRSWIDNHSIGCSLCDPTCKGSTIILFSSIELLLICSWGCNLNGIWWKILLIDMLENFWPKIIDMMENWHFHQFIN